MHGRSVASDKVKSQGLGHVCAPVGRKTTLAKTLCVFKLHSVLRTRARGRIEARCNPTSTRVNVKL